MLLQKKGHMDPVLVAEGPSANAAAAALLGKPCSTGRVLWGLTLMQVKEKIQALAGVEYCVDFEDWLPGIPRPRPPPEV